MDPVSDSARLRWLGSSGSMGVKCRRCPHRALVPASTLRERHGIMRRLNDIRFVCSRCGGRKVEIAMCEKPSALKRFFRE